MGKETAHWASCHQALVTVRKRALEISYLSWARDEGIGVIGLWSGTLHTELAFWGWGSRKAERFEVKNITDCFVALEDLQP
jgi:hypothetical protein